MAMPTRISSPPNKHCNVIRRQDHCAILNRSSTGRFLSHLPLNIKLLEMMKIYEFWRMTFDTQLTIFIGGIESWYVFERFLFFFLLDLN